MSLFKKTLNKLIKKNISVATVESCTGGLLASTFIKHTNASKIFKSGFITYSNESKIKFLKIKKNVLNKHGAVSYEVAKCMVENLYKIEKSLITISTTGIAGPKGGTINKPVGLIYIGLKYKFNIKIYKKRFKGTRIKIQKDVVKFIFNKINHLI